MSLGFEAGSTAECEFAGFAGEIEVNGCALVLHPGSGSGDEFTGTVDGACPPGEAIAVKGGNCEVQIGSQTGLGPVGYDRQTAAEPEDVEASFEMKAASGFAYAKTLDGESNSRSRSASAVGLMPA